MKFSPLQIPGKSIRPPDSVSQHRCPHCNKHFDYPKLIIDPKTKKTILVCPRCNRPL